MDRCKEESLTTLRQLADGSTLGSLSAELLKKFLPFASKRANSMLVEIRVSQTTV